MTPLLGRNVLLNTRFTLLVVLALVIGSTSSRADEAATSASPEQPLATIPAGSLARFVGVLFTARGEQWRKTHGEDVAGGPIGSDDSASFCLPELAVPQNLNFLVQTRGTAPAPGAVTAPFKLTPEQREERDLALKEWDKQNQEAQNLQCTFFIWETESVFGLVTQKAGWLKYERPYRGEYMVNRVGRRDGKGVVKWREEMAAHAWYTGDSYFYIDAADRALIETRLPESLKSSGKRLGSIALLFDLTSAELRERFFFRVITKPQDASRGEIWLEAIPKGPQGPSDLKRAELILNANDHRLSGLKLVFPGFLDNGRDYEVCYLFTNYMVNRPGLAVKDPSLPEGWKRKLYVGTDPPTAVVADKPAPAGPGAPPPRSSAPGLPVERPDLPSDAPGLPSDAP